MEIKEKEVEKEGCGETETARTRLPGVIKTSMFMLHTHTHAHVEIDMGWDGMG